MKRFIAAMRNWGLHLKVFFLLLVSLIAVALAGYVVNENSRVLKETLNTLTIVDPETQMLRDLLADLAGAENNFRIYSITNDQSYFDAYNNLISKVVVNIEYLKEKAVNDESKLLQFDSVLVLLARRQSMVDAYIIYKLRRERFDFAEKTISQIKSGPLDTIPNRLRTTTRVVTVHDTISPGTAEKPVKPKETQGVFRKIKKALSKPQPAENENPVSTGPIVLTTTRVITDTSLLRPSDSVILRNVRNVLSNVRRQDVASYEGLKRQELNMLQNSSEIISQIMSIFRQLELTQTLLSNRRSKEAFYKADRSILSIVIIGSVSLLAILVLIGLILGSIRRSNRLKRNLIEANLRTAELARVKEEFLANMSHEIRTPLNAIIGFSDQLIHTPLNTVQTEYLGAVRRSSKHLLETVNDILDLSRIGSGKLQLEKIPFRLHDVIDDVIVPFRLSATEKGIQFVFGCSVPPGKVIEGDPLRLKQILYNLLSNALKFTEKGTVGFECQLECNEGICEAIIRVTDTGIGIPVEKLGEIFEDFRQAESSQARRFGGSGLGLAISRRLARLQQGDITVKSTPGSGSEFTLKIPFPESDQTPAAEEKLAEVSSFTLAGRRLLLVDDDVFNILLARIIAENAGMQVDVASNGRQAIEILNQNTYDIIMTDVQMPEISGFELVHFIRNSAIPELSKIPVIAFTAAKVGRFDPEYTSAGFNEVLQKPFSEADFITHASAYLSAPETFNQGIYKSAFAEKLYDLRETEKFTSGNNLQLASIIRSFIHTSQASLHELWNFCDDDNYQAIRMLAHKLLTAYGHMGVSEAIPVLENLETLDENTCSKEEMKNLLVKITSVNNRLHPLLEAELLRLSGPDGKEQE